MPGNIHLGGFILICGNAFISRGQTPPFVPVSAPKVKNDTNDDQDDAIDGHDLMRRITRVITRIRHDSEKMPYEQQDSCNTNNYSANPHKIVRSAWLAAIVFTFLAGSPLVGQPDLLKSTGSGVR